MLPWKYRPIEPGGVVPIERTLQNSLSRAVVKILPPYLHVGHLGRKGRLNSLIESALRCPPHRLFAELYRYCLGPARHQALPNNICSSAISHPTTASSDGLLLQCL